MEEKLDDKNPICPWDTEVAVNKQFLTNLKQKITGWGRLINDVAGSVYTDECVREQLYLISDAILASVNENYDEERYDSQIWDEVEEEKIVSK